MYKTTPASRKAQSDYTLATRYGHADAEQKRQTFYAERIADIAEAIAATITLTDAQIDRVAEILKGGAR